MSKPVVYLAGPILGQTETSARHWRRQCTLVLDENHIRAIDPLRCESSNGGVFGLKGLHGKHVHSKNVYDVRTCDLVLAYFPQQAYGKVSWGTLIEVGMAYAAAKPIILVAEAEQAKVHPVLIHSASFVVNILEEGIDECIKLLGGYA